MSDRIMEAGSSVGGNRCSAEEIVAIPGLNLIIAPDRQHGSCSALNLSLTIAGATGFLERKPEHGRVMVFSLENAREKTEQMLAQYNIMIGDITVVYAYMKGTFGNRIEEGLDVYLRDNPQTKMIVVDSLEKIVEAEFGQMEYADAYRKLCDIKNVADRHGVSLVVGIYDGPPKGIGMLTGIADTVLKIVTKDENQNNHKYTFHVTQRDVPEKEIITEFDADNCTWKQIVDK